jgi:hypothetical protein
MGSATRDKATPLGDIKTVRDISPRGGAPGFSRATMHIVTVACFV